MRSVFHRILYVCIARYKQKYANVLVMCILEHFHSHKLRAKKCFKKEEKKKTAERLYWIEYSQLNTNPFKFAPLSTTLNSLKKKDCINVCMQIKQKNSCNRMHMQSETAISFRWMRCVCPNTTVLRITRTRLEQEHQVAWLCLLFKAKQFYLSMLLLLLLLIWN